MLEVIPFEDGKIVFFKESDFWNEVLKHCKNGTKYVDIATYNFNFRDKYERTFYTELSKLANLGVNIRLLYAKMTFSEEDKLEIEEIFKNFVLCAELLTNHSKIFIIEDFAFIGSANFSYSSNNNYECGVIFNNKEIISKIRKIYGGKLLEESEFKNVPESHFPPFFLLDNLKDTVEKLEKVERKEDLYKFDLQETIPKLHDLDTMEEDFIRIGFSIPKNFDWWEFYLKIYNKGKISDYEYQNFKKYINDLSVCIIDASNYIQNQYKSIGKIEFIKRWEQ